LQCQNNAIKCTVTQIEQKPGVKPMAQNMLRQTAKRISDTSIILTNKEEHSQQIAGLKTDMMKQKRQIIVLKKQIDVLQHNLSEERALSFNGSRFALSVNDKACAKWFDELIGVDSLKFDALCRRVLAELFVLWESSMAAKKDDSLEMMYVAYELSKEFSEIYETDFAHSILSIRSK
jgi:hypothetical protein